MEVVGLLDGEELGIKGLGVGAKVGLSVGT